MQPAGSVERVHFDNFALISHTRDSPCGAGLTLPGVPETNPRALRLPVASIKPVSKISPAIPRPGEKQTPRRDVQNMLIHTHTHTHTHTCAHTRARQECSRKRVRLCRGDGNLSAFSFSSFLTRSHSSLPSRFLSLSLSSSADTRSGPWIIRIYTQGVM